MSVRVRFAPSPTGHLHIGNVRTALFNYLFARHSGGKFILRIEDTDVERSRQEYADSILRDLKLLGLEWDEGPFHQSERLHLYQEYLSRLEKENRVYQCYCTQEELEARRREALAMKRAPRYDNRCRTLSDEEKRRRQAQGIRPTIRFKVDTTEPIVVHDLIRGEVKFNPEEIGDFVIMRSDPRAVPLSDSPHSEAQRGHDQYLPTFHMSVCVDDGLMKITHVIRGEDHLSNSPRHVLLFQAFGFEAPKFAHLSLIHGPGGEPLSKRYGAVKIPEFIEERGYLPEALRNYLALLGWSPKDNREIFTPEELTAAFQIENVTHHAAIFTEDKLVWINSEHLKQMPQDDYLTRALDYMRKHDVSVVNETVTKEVLLGLKKDIHRFDELVAAFDFLKEERYQSRLADEKAKAGEGFKILQDGKNVIVAAKSILPRLTSRGEILFGELSKELQKSVSEKGKKLYMPLRVAVTGEIHGMEQKKIFELLEPAAIQKRLQFAEEILSQP